MDAGARLVPAHAAFGTGLDEGRTVSDPLDLGPGDIFAEGYRVVRPLRSGGMGRLYVVVQLSTNKLRVLKLLAEQLVEREESRARFLREARAAAAIDSDHVVDVVTAGVDALTNAPYIVMELLDGQDLCELVETGGPVPFEDVRLILTHVGHALERAHLQGIVHRDLKPENVFLALPRRATDRFTAKVLDFGVAKLLSEGSAAEGTQPVGSPLFMAPEQTDPHGRIGPQTDVWALGLLTYYLLTGSYYWASASQDVAVPVLLREVCFDELPPASQRADSTPNTVKLPEGFDEWFAKCVCREIDDRYPDGGAAVQAFLRDVWSPEPWPSNAPEVTIDDEHAERKSAPEPPISGREPTVEVEASDLLPVPSMREPAPPSEPGDHDDKPHLELVQDEPASFEPSEPEPAPDEPVEEEGFEEQAPSDDDLAREGLLVEHTREESVSALPATVASPSSPPAASDPWTEPHDQDVAEADGNDATHAQDDPWALSPSAPPMPASELSPIAVFNLPPEPAPLAEARPHADTPLPQAVAVDHKPSAKLSLVSLMPSILIAAGIALGLSSGLAIGLRPHKVTVEAGASASALAAHGAPSASAPEAAAEPHGCPRGSVHIGDIEVCFDRVEVSASAYQKCEEDGACAPLGGEAAPAKRADIRKARSAFCNGPADRGDHPANCVTQAAASNFCAWRHARLPTAREWKAAYAAARQKVGTAERPTANLCRWECAAWWYEHGQFALPPLDGDDGFDGTSPVGSFKAGPSVVLDMEGNVSEWVSDAEGDSSVALGSNFATNKIAGSEPDSLRVPQGAPSETIGFRCVNDP